MSSELTEATAPSAAATKPKADIYTAMLVISLVALVFGIVMLVIEMGKFGWDAKASQVKTRISHAAPAVRDVDWA